MPPLECNKRVKLFLFCTCAAIIFIWMESTKQFKQKRSAQIIMLQNNLNWVFLGDSTMRMTFEAFVEESKTWNCKKLKTANRCDLYQYFGMKPRANWTYPTIFEGPRFYGIGYPHCIDCSICTTYYYICENNTLEFLPVGFARDVTLQTIQTSTTQQTIAVYLRNKQKHICIVNTGIHDQAIKGLADAGEIFVHNVREYLGLLNPVCERIYWVAMTAVLDEPIHPQRNERIQLWNAMVENLIATEMPNIYFINEYTASFDLTLHKDNVHMITPYYRNFSRLLMRIILSP